jgi:hypothetical protein
VLLSCIRFNNNDEADDGYFLLKSMKGEENYMNMFDFFETRLKRGSLKPWKKVERKSVWMEFLPEHTEKLMISVDSLT